jgi:hypothetical protein
VTRGSIAGQIKALSMIVAIEGLIPDRRLSPSAKQPAAPPIDVDIYEPEWLRERQRQAACEESGAVAEAPPVPDPEPAPNPDTDVPPLPVESNFDRNQPSLADALIPQALSRVPLATGNGFLDLLGANSSPRLPFSIKKGLFGRRR